MTGSSFFGLIIDRTILAWMIALARVSGVLVSAPFFGSAAISPRVKAGLALLLAVFLAPFVTVPSAARPAAEIALILAGEFAIGFFLGFTLQLIFDGVLLAGQVCGVQMGYSLASVLNPDSPADSPVLSTFYQLFLVFLFLQMRVPHWLLRGLARSFEYLPPGRLSLTLPAVSGLFEFASGMWLAGLQIAAPIMVATLFADVALGFLGKASPQLPVLFIGISLKNLIGLVLLGGAISFWPHFFDARFNHALEASERILKLAR
ncbi:MAG TPA: flagellar biosynthetic protein FliR [Terriglobales bacterium]|nr:flagellar biosynthetic protein FliR [Terriglobales bacterium]